jgi:hypothetical protein
LIPSSSAKAALAPGTAAEAGGDSDRATDMHREGTGEINKRQKQADEKESTDRRIDMNLRKNFFIEPKISHKWQF